MTEFASLLLDKKKKKKREDAEEDEEDKIGDNDDEGGSGGSTKGGTESRTQLCGKLKCMLDVIAEKLDKNSEHFLRVAALAKTARDLLKEDVDYVSNVHLVCSLAWHALMAELIGKNGKLLRQNFAACVSKASDIPMLDAGHDMVSLNNFFSALVTFLTKGQRETETLPESIRNALQPLVDSFPSQEEFDLSRQGRDGLRQGNLALLASEYERTLVDSLEKKVIDALVYLTLASLSESDRASYVSNKVDAKSELRRLVQFSLVDLSFVQGNSCEIKLRYFGKDGKQLTSIEKRTAALKSGLVHISKGGKISKRTKKKEEGVKEQTLRHFTIRGVPDLWLTNGFEQVPAARDLLLVLGALVEEEDAMVKFVSSASNELPPPLKRSVAKADESWKAWGKLVGLEGEELLKFARKSKVAAPADEKGGKVYRMVLGKATAIVESWKKQVQEWHPHSHLAVWPLKTRSSRRTTQLTFSGLLLVLAIRENVDIVSAKVQEKEKTELQQANLQGVKAKMSEKSVAKELRAVCSSARNVALKVFSGLSQQERNAVAGKVFLQLRTLLRKARAMVETEAEVEAGIRTEAKGAGARFSSAGTGVETDVAGAWAWAWAWVKSWIWTKAGAGVEAGVGTGATKRPLADNQAQAILETCLKEVREKYDAKIANDMWTNGANEMLRVVVPKVQDLLDLIEKEARKSQKRHKKEDKAEPLEDDVGDEEQNAEPMEESEDEEAELRFRVEIRHKKGGHNVFVLERACSSKEKPDRDFKAMVQEALQDKWKLDANVVQTGTLRSVTPSFEVTKRFFWSSTTDLVLEFEPFALDSLVVFLSVGPAPSYGSRFAVFNPQALHDLWRRTLRRTVVGEEILKLLAEALRDIFKEKLVLPNAFADHLRVTQVFASNKKTERLWAETRAAVFLLGTSQEHLLVKACKENFSFAGLQTNGYEYRILFDCFGIKSSGKKAHAAEKDAAQAELIRKSNEALIADLRKANPKVQITWAGAGGIDMGMTGLDANRLTAKEAACIVDARQYVLQKGDAAIQEEIFAKLRLAESDGILDFKKQSGSFSVSLGQLQTERQTKAFQRKIDKKKKKFEAKHGSRLIQAGGLEGNKKWKKIPLNQFLAEAKRVLSVVHLRVQHFRHKRYKEQRFVARVATESIAARVFQKFVALGKEAAQQQQPWSGSKEGRALPGKKRSHVEEPTPTSFFVFTICPGDWNGAGPKRSNSEFPRKQLVRRVCRLAREYSFAQRAKSTGLIVGWNPVNEYRSSLQTPQPLPLVLGLRIDRYNPPCAEKDSSEQFKYVVEHRPWKLLYCPFTETLLQRDMSAAWAIALQYAFGKRAAELKFKEEEQVLPGYRRPQPQQQKGP